ncbi:hypothetical protein MMC14_008360 [Varicellaria rhodocarpa]|nr:hypothetical protein [Varicellaria rhodocarpa]
MPGSNPGGIPKADTQSYNTIAARARQALLENDRQRAATELQRSQHMRRGEIRAAIERVQMDFLSSAQKKAAIEALKLEVRFEVVEEMKAEMHDGVKDSVIAEIRAERKRLEPKMQQELKDEMYAKLKEDHGAAMMEKLKQELKAQVCAELKEEWTPIVQDHLKETLRPVVTAALCKQLKSGVRQELRDEMPEEVYSEIYSEVHQEVQQKMDEDLREGLREKLRTELCPMVAEELRNQLRPNIIDELKHDYSEILEESIATPVTLQDSIIKTKSENEDGVIAFGTLQSATIKLEEDFEVINTSTSTMHGAEVNPFDRHASESPPYSAEYESPPLSARRIRKRSQSVSSDLESCDEDSTSKRVRSERYVSDDRSVAAFKDCEGDSQYSDGYHSSDYVSEEGEGFGGEGGYGDDEGDRGYRDDEGEEYGEEGEGYGPMDNYEEGGDFYGELPPLADPEADPDPLAGTSSANAIDLDDE